MREERGRGKGGNELDHQRGLKGEKKAEKVDTPRIKPYICCSSNIG
jgi:hypothetical protein